MNEMFEMLAKESLKKNVKKTPKAIISPINEKSIPIVIIILDFCFYLDSFSIIRSNCFSFIVF